MAIEKIIYTAHAVASGGREGFAKSDDGKLDVKLDRPSEMGGLGKGTNPEQLFAAGYAACFIGALKVVAGEQKLRLPPDTSIQSSVHFGPLAGGKKGYGIAVELEVHIPGLERKVVEKLAEEAHQICPYSNATRNNIDVKLSIA
jgi:Ohr subfamily peroxiredoxin